MDCFASLAMTASANGLAGFPMRFDLVDLQLFIAVAETRSITNGAAKVHLALASASERIKGLEEALGVALLDARPPWRRTDVGRRKPARSRQGRHAQRRCDARRSARPLPSGAKATVRFLANTSGLSEYLPKTLAAFLGAAPPYLDRRRGARAPRSPARIADRLRRSRARRRTRAAGQYRAASPFSEDRLGAGGAAARTNWRTGGRSISARWWSVTFVGLLNSIALHAHISGHAARSAPVCAFVRG